MTNLLTSWKTTLMGGIAMLCAANEMIDALPAKWAGTLRGACGIAIALGLIAAKDADKSNAANPVETAKPVA